MKKLVLALALLAFPALAQQAPDPGLGICQQISMQKEAQLIQTAVQAQMLSKQLEEAKAELAKLKQPPKE